jgi:hypothetical protein
VTQGPPPPVGGAGQGEPIPAQGISVQGTATVGVGLAISQVTAMLQMLVVARILGPEQTLRPGTDPPLRTGGPVPIGRVCWAGPGWGPSALCRQVGRGHCEEWGRGVTPGARW